MDKIVQIKIITRDEAIDRAIEFLKTTPSPNLIPSTTQFNKGIAGITMFSGDATKETRKATDHAFFNIYGEQGCEDVLLADVVDFLYFYDRMPDNILYGQDINLSLNYIVGEGINILFEQSRIVERCIAKIKKNTDRFFSTFFNDLMDKQLEKRVGTTVSELKNDAKPTSFKFMSPATEIPVYDRLGIISFYDNNNVVVVKDEDSFLLVVLAENEYIKVHRTMAKYNSIKAIFEECAWEMKRE
jgi:hypothetical protein